VTRRRTTRASPSRPGRRHERDGFVTVLGRSRACAVRPSVRSSPAPDLTRSTARCTPSAQPGRLLRQTDLAEAVRAVTAGFGANVIIDAAGRPETSEQAFRARNLAGTAVLVAVPHPGDHDRAAGPGRLLPRRITDIVVYGDRLPSRDFPVLVDLHRQGRLPLATFVSERIGLGDVEQGFEKVHGGHVLRSVVGP
jgi:Zn-dependent alcohol dehydrogenase